MVANFDHSALTGANLHEAFRYVQSSDPGAVGAGVYWLDTTSEPFILKRRNTGNTAWVTIGASGSGFSNPMTTAGDLIVGGASGAATRLGKGADGQVLTVDPVTHLLTWATPSGGGSASRGAYSSRPAAGTAGAIYLPDDVPRIYEDNGSAWKAYGPIWALTAPPLVATWTWVNQSTATASDDADSIHLSIPANATTNMRALVRTAPSRPYTITAAFTRKWRQLVNPSIGLLFRESGSGKIAAFEVGENSSNYFISTDKLNSTTSYNANYVSLAYRKIPDVVWLRIAEDTTNRTCSWSYDGYHWEQVHQVARLDFLTAGADQVGFFADSSGTGAVETDLLSWVAA